MNGADDGELYLEYRQSENVVIDDGKIKCAAFDTGQGFGLRAVSDEATGYAHASEMSEAALKRAADTVKAVHRGGAGALAIDPVGTNVSLYDDDNPLGLVPFEDKVALLSEMDAYARGKDERVKQVSASLGGEWQAVQIVRAGGHRVAERRGTALRLMHIPLGGGGR